MRHEPNVSGVSRQDQTRNDDGKPYQIFGPKDGQIRARCSESQD